MNKIVIAGRLVRDPELRNTAGGLEVCGFTVAVNRRVKKGEEPVADFIDCTAWGKSGVFVSTWFHKGDGIVVDGRLESSKWQDKEGKNRVSWAVTVDNVEFPQGKKGEGGSSGGYSAPVPDAGAPAGSFTELDDDGSLPF